MWKLNHAWRTSAVVWVLTASLSLLGTVRAQMQPSETGLCATGAVNCILPVDTRATSSSDAAAYASVTPKPRIVNLQVRVSHGGPLAHRWLEVESSQGEVTIGYGPATLPFIDMGQISIFDAQGNIERVGGVHLPFVDFNYAKPPGAGHSIGKPIPLTVAQADALIAKQRHRKFIGPYIPIFHDCHTWVCTVLSSVRGKSSLPCYLLFKGYW